MALEKTELVDLIEVVADGCVQVRVKTSVHDDGMEIGTSFKRYIVVPGEDYSSQPQRVQAICAAVHTAELIAAYKAAQAKAEV